MESTVPHVIITVSGGVAEVLQDNGATVEIWDYDNCEHCDPDETDPTAFGDYCPDYCTEQKGM